MSKPTCPTLRASLIILLLPAAVMLGCAQGGSGPGGAAAGGVGGSGTGGRGGSAAGGRGGSAGPATGGADGTGGSTTPGTGGSGGSGAGTGGLGTGGSGAGGSGGSGQPDGGPAPDMTMPPMPPPTAEDPLPPCGRMVAVADQGALGPALTGAMPGDCIVLADGNYTFPAITAKATADKPIVVRAANVLKVVVPSGNVTIQDGAYVVVEGFHFRSPGQIKMANCDHCRVSRFRVERPMAGGEIDWITVSGTSKYCRIDHNDIGPQGQVGNMVMLSGQGDQVVQYTRIDHNHFHDVTYGGGNGWELIRAGLSGWTFSKAYTVIERNLFTRGDSDPETISVKSSDNIIRYNTMRATAGQFTLRHGNRTQVYGNYILGDGRGNTGFRVYGGGHKIFNNYINVTGAGILIDSGTSNDTSGALTDHKQTYDIEVVFNTVVGGSINIGSGKPLAPRNITVGYNLVQGNVNAIGGAQVKSMGNIVSGTAALSGGVTKAEPGLIKMGDIFRLTMGSPAIDAADAMFPYIMDDADGRPRSGKFDVGAEELGNGMARFGLLTEKDVGPMAP